ncbi:MAG: hypothetical protein NUV56_03975 [Candidatus Uhrbacteria bacterium]|nr:hypothetical protein [Candidatus Uhrbacteria bacterium]
MGKEEFDRGQFERLYTAFNSAYEEEEDKSAGRGLARVFKDEGADLLEAAVGHDEWPQLHNALARRNRSDIGAIVQRMLKKSAA